MNPNNHQINVSVHSIPARLRIIRASRLSEVDQSETSDFVFSLLLSVYEGTISTVAEKVLASWPQQHHGGRPVQSPSGQCCSSGRSVTSPFAGRSVLNGSALEHWGLMLLTSCPHTLWAHHRRMNGCMEWRRSTAVITKPEKRWTSDPENLDMHVCARLRDGTDLLALLPHLLWSPFTQQGTVSVTPPTLPPLLFLFPSLLLFTGWWEFSTACPLLHLLPCCSVSLNSPALFNVFLTCAVVHFLNFSY